MDHGGQNYNSWSQNQKYDSDLLFANLDVKDDDHNKVGYFLLSMKKIESH